MTDWCPVYCGMMAKKKEVNYTKYEIVTLPEKITAGISAKTSNQSPDMPIVIGCLWKKFFEDKLYQSIPNKRDGKTLGIYTDYESDEKGTYTMAVACEVISGDAVPKELEIRKISSGKYAKFVLKGEMHQVVADFWQKLWAMDLTRAFGSDFEEYQNDSMEQAQIHVYISLKK